ncbi:MAG: Dam family site-specific DNA-(adenine-N6)-methyltransferase [Legionellaceae bacterium]|nr:Dam family site-specific DNA-(adenine-N6)-methyltransferase [Legionellaceae bacterium]
MKKVRPFLKWAGNKYHCLNYILPSFPNTKRLIEPFTGSGAVFMNTNFSQYILAEENHDLITLFRFLQDEGTTFINYCELLFIEGNNQKAKYYHMRDVFNQSTEPRYRAALFLYLNRHGYNGLCRYNSKGIYNVPFGLYKKPYFPRREMELFHAKCNVVTFIQNDFRNTFDLAQKGDLIYCDPPYAPLGQVSNFSSYTSSKFGEAEQIALATAAKEAAARGISVIISNHDTATTRQYYDGSKIISFPVSRFINSDITQRSPVRELIAIF